jgi:hypothetical protein
MRSSTVAVLVVLFGAGTIAACSSKSPTRAPPPADAGAHDSGTGAVDSGHAADAVSPEDSTTGADGGTYNFPCANTGQPCETSEVCCVTPSPGLSFACSAKAACPAANQLVCDGPEDCSGAAPLCCAVETTNGEGTYPSCTPKNIGTSCATTCTTHIGTSCTDTTSVILCHAASDCSSDPSNDQCCTFSLGAASLTFCTSEATALEGGATCH